MFSRNGAHAVASIEINRTRIEAYIFMFRTEIGLFQKKITFLVRKFQNFCVWFLTLYAFIICQVIIRTQYYTNASLISAPVLILYQNVRGT